MLQSVKKLLLILLALAGVQRAEAFSLIGPYESWMVREIGYQIDGDLGGPMDLGEEFRQNVPVLTYGFDASFLDFFGQDGVRAVEAAIGILNRLPAVSQMSPDLHEFPLDTRRFNFQAAALGIVDLKTWTLSQMLEEMGVAGAERWVWTLRSRRNIGGDTFEYITIHRNYDPLTLRQTPYVNGTLYTYQVIQTYAQPETWEAVPLTVDPTAPSITTVAALGGVNGGFSDPRGLSIIYNSGLFYDGLTRDDVGALRYLYSPQNINMENLTNAISGTGNPWSPVIGGTNTGTNLNLVVTALRPGIDKIAFQRVNYDSLLGQFFTNEVNYTDVYITNSTRRTQTVKRALSTPDIIFAASDIGPATGPPNLLGRTLDFDVASSNTVTAGLVGPGTIRLPIVVTYSKIHPYWVNIDPGSEEVATKGITWGYYDGSTNAPIIFPSGSSIHELEAQVLQHSQSNPYRLP